MTASFSLLNPAARSRFVLSVEHAGNEWPDAMPAPILPADWKTAHYTYDAGIKRFAEKLAAALQCPAILGRYTRLLIDLNRIPGSNDLIATSTDNLALPMNVIDDSEWERRLHEYYQPYHTALHDLIANAGADSIHLALHSYTKQRSVDAAERPWHLGILYSVESKLVKHLQADVERIPGMVIGRNQPYDQRKDGLPGVTALHSTAIGREGFTLEFRNDQLTDDTRCDFWVARIAAALKEYAVAPSP